METFTKVKRFLANPGFRKQRQKILNNIDLDSIDSSIIKIISGFLKLPYCFTLQCCYGHFLYDGHEDPYSLDPLPVSEKIGDVEYKIAYIAFCIQDSPPGKILFKKLSKVPEIDPEYIQFGSASWFWKKQVNTYALQVEPERYCLRDTASINYEEALHVERIRNLFFQRLEDIIQEMKKISG